MRVLVADDDLLMRTFVSAILSARGHEVVQAGDGAEALRKFRAEPFPVVIFDWFMPGLDGPEVLRALRAEGARPFAVLLSGNTDEAALTKARILGFRQVLAKPLDPSALDQAMARAEALLA